MYQALRNILSKKRKWFTWRCFRELDPKLNRKITALNICRHSAACLFVCFNLAILFFEHENCGVFRWHFCNQLWLTSLISPHKENPRSFGYCPKYSQPPPPPLHKVWATFPLFCKMSYFTKNNGWNDNFEIKNQLRGCLWWWHWSPWTHG